MSVVNETKTEDKVLVLDMKGAPMDGTARFGKVRRLLRDGKAKIVNRYPFTIQLLYEPENKKIFEEKKAASKKQRKKPYEKNTQAKPYHKNEGKHGTSDKSSGGDYKRPVKRDSAKNDSGNNAAPAKSVYINGKMRNVQNKTTKTVKTKSGKTIIINSYK